MGYVMEYSCNLEHQLGYVDGHCKGYHQPTSRSMRPTRLEWDFLPACVKQIEAACTFAEEQISDLELYVLQHDEFGKGEMKKCGISPDAFVQMALQMAYFKVRVRREGLAIGGSGSWREGLVCKVRARRE